MWFASKLDAHHLQFDSSIFNLSSELSINAIDVYCKESDTAFNFISHLDTSSQIIQKLNKTNYDRHVFLVDTTDQKYDMTSFISTLEQLSRNNQIIVPFFGFDQCVDFISQLISHTHVSYEAEFENYISSFVQDEDKWLVTMGRMTGDALPIPIPQCFMIQEELATIYNFVNASSQTLKDCCLDKSCVKSVEAFFEE